MISLALLVLAPATASASWLEPKFLSGAGQDAADPHVAMDKDGDALVVWPRVNGGFYRIQARARTAAGKWRSVSPPLSAAGQHATDPRVALDENGDALIVWTRSDGTYVIVQARTRSRAGVFGPIKNVSATGHDAGEPMVAIDDDGDAIVTWYRSDGTDYRVQARVRSRSGAWGPITNLSATGFDAFGPRVAMDDRGDGIVVWYGADGAYQRVQYRIRPASGSWRATKQASRLDLPASGPAVDMDRDGDAVIVWQGEDASALLRIEGRYLPWNGSPGSIQTLSDVTGTGPQVAMSPGGRATVVWQRDPGTIGLVEGRVRSPTGSWGPVKQLSDTPGDAVEPRVAAGTNGSTAVWRRQDGDGNLRVESRPWLPFAWRPFTVLSPDDRDSLLQEVAMEEVGGKAIAVWRSTDGTNYRIEMSAGP